MSNVERKWTCSAGCGLAFVTTDITVASPPWDYLEISRTYRCPACTEALRKASTTPGSEFNTASADISPYSRGALPKATAHTIAAPTVRS